MPLATGDQIEITYRGDLAGQKVMTTMHYVVNGSTSVQAFLDDLLSIGTFFANPANEPMDTYLAANSGSLHLTEVWAQRVFPARTIKTITPVDLNGTFLGNSVTANIAGVVTRKSDLAGRKMISNLHLPGVPTDEIAGGIFSAAYKDALDDFAAESILGRNVPAGGVAVINLLPAVLHRPLAAGNYDFLVLAQSNDRARTMRRRTVGLGE